ncbi:allantoicase [Phyllobacterium sp. 628]|uniref:allantoicase n=1 Tax=Phyllobacterium sp. 628 TaxID=2718938 RepID=UPI00166269F4|nr:allantoicase [Phyllobacterium sp. 628]QND51880.1 allantoicase [Phyllobacterium sp. 628]
MVPPINLLPEFTKDRINLASAGLGAQAVFATDEFFAPLERLLHDAPAIFYPDKYDDHGKWMDGWESRRRRGPGHDFAVVKLAAPGIIHGFDVDTSHFTGNYPPACAIEGCRVEGNPTETTQWMELLPQSPLGASSSHFFAHTSHEVWTHVRLHIYPDGGVARLRVYGEPWRDWSAVAKGEEIDLASALNGGRVLAYSDAHYGALHRLLSPGRGINMGDGWETRRRREPGNDWLIVQLGHTGTISRIVVDTAHYKGNYPDRCSVHGANLGRIAGGLSQSVVTSSMFWPEILPEKKLSMDAVHDFAMADLLPAGPVSHVRLNIFPDGGVSRLRIFGTI